MTNTEDLRKLSAKMARAFGWKVPSDDPRAVTTLLNGAADDIDRMRTALNDVRAWFRDNDEVCGWGPIDDTIKAALGD